MANSTTTNFFEKPSEKSKVKTLIVTEFFKVYFEIINRSVGKHSKEIIYLDLFSGPGIYSNGDYSTPMQLLELVNQSNTEDMRQKLRIVFNDEDSEFANKLDELINGHEVKSKLKFPPIVTNVKAGDVDVSGYTGRRTPIFSFIDPWGYKDISVKRMWALVKNIGSDCIFFFNSNRLLMDNAKEAQSIHLKQIFGDQLQELELMVKNDNSCQKIKAQKAVDLFTKNLISEMNNSGYEGYKLFVLPFSFGADNHDKISHHIVFISKSYKAIEEMKKVMTKHSNLQQREFGFDTKKMDEDLQISFFNKEDHSSEHICEIIESYNQVETDSHLKTWSIERLMSELDRFFMKENFKVTPYLPKDIMETIKKLNAENRIEIVSTNSKSNVQRITYNTEFKIKKNCRFENV